MKKFIVMGLCAVILTGCGGKDDQKASIELVSGELKPGETLVVEFDVDEKLLEDTTAWIGVIPSNVEQGPEGPADAVDVAYKYLSDIEDERVELTLPVELAEEEYDIRIYSSDDSQLGKQVAALSLVSGKMISNEDVKDEPAEEDKKVSEVKDSNDPACLIGDWKMTNFSEYLVASVKGNIGGLPGGFADSVTATDSGDLILSFDGENMTMRDNGFVVSMSLLGTSQNVSIDASGVNGYTAENGVLKGAVSGNKVDVAESGGLYSVSMENFVSKEVNYECSGDSLTWKQNENFPVDLKFTRI